MGGGKVTYSNDKGEGTYDLEVAKGPRRMILRRGNKSESKVSQVAY